MKRVYICSPFRAKDSAELDRNIDYAQELTRKALEAGLAPITPHLYITQCLNEDNPEERAVGLAAGLELLKGCDFVIAGIRYGVSEGMSREIQTAGKLGIAVVNADQLRQKMQYEERKTEEKVRYYAKHSYCEFCTSTSPDCGRALDCAAAYQRAYEYAKAHFTNR